MSKRRAPGVPTVIRGAGKGLVATAAMSAFLLAAQRGGLLRRQPPRIIVDSLLPELPPRPSRVMALIAHLGYGAAGGVMYEAATKVVPQSVRSGTAFGLAVWAAGYEGWLPLMGILPPAHRDRRGRAVTMVLAHLVYGFSLGL